MSKIENDWLNDMPALTVKGNPGITPGVPQDIPLSSIINSSGDLDGGRADSLYLSEDDFDCGGA